MKWRYECVKVEERLERPEGRNAGYSKRYWRSVLRRHDEQVGLTSSEASPEYLTLWVKLKVGKHYWLRLQNARKPTKKREKMGPCAQEARELRRKYYTGGVESQADVYSNKHFGDETRQG